tara:strand:+ start:402 stop:818 length:417 start_codon:yes stop_codon:yes gene_type:complete
MEDIRSIPADKFNADLANALKEISEFKAPAWSLYVKTSPSKKRPSFEPDFWHKRAASILRQIYIKGIVGVNRLRTRYGGRKERGGKPEEFRKAGGKIIRVILQQAEAAGLLEKTKTPKTGRQLTAEGKELLEKVGGSK